LKQSARTARASKSGDVYAVKAGESAYTTVTFDLVEDLKSSTGTGVTVPAGPFVPFQFKDL